MAENLTGDLKQLEQYYFHKPIKEDAIQLISGGNSLATNYRLEDSGKTYLARLMSMAQPLTSREKECLITEHVGKMGIGPKVYYQNPQQGILLTEFIEGSTANYNDMVNKPNRHLITANIKKLHQTTQLTFPKASTLPVNIQRAFKRADSTILQQQLDVLELIEPLKKLCYSAENNLTAALTHGDLNPNNILIGKNKVYFIDWTDAGIGDPFVDISWHAMFFPLALHKNLLEDYFDDVNTYVQQKLLCYYCLRLFLPAAECVEYAKRLSKDCEHLLIDILRQKNLPEPCNLIRDMSSKKMTLDNTNNLLLFSAAMLNFLSQLTKTDIFLSAIEELNHNV